MAIYRGTGGWSNTTGTAEADAVVAAQVAVQNALEQVLESETNAESYKNMAEAAAITATNSATGIEGYATLAATKAVEASASATASASSASAASTSETNALASANTATTQAGIATTKATEAATSATNAANSATTASTQATNAASSATNAANSATTATTQATNASNSATAAATSATNAANSATTASSAATTATNQANAATTQATNAASSATLASDWAQKTTGTVDGCGYSAKYWAEQAAGSVSAGVIDDAVTSTTKTWSSSKVSTELSGKATTSHNHDASNITTGTLPVARGGTGATTLTGIVKGNGTGAFTAATAETDYVTPSGTGTLSNKTIQAGTFTDGYTEEVFTVSGTAPALSPTNGSIQLWSLTGNSTPTFGTFNSGQSITLMIDDGSAYTITWSTVTWKTNGGVAPTLNTTGYTVVVLWKVGSVVYGARVGDA